ncbi:hypothetical protein JCM14076_06320 [Methylosoma difficile]
MITSQEAEKLAKEQMINYVNACKCQAQDDVANVLMKLASVCGVGINTVVGNADAVDRLQGVTDFIKSLNTN